MSQDQAALVGLDAVVAFLARLMCSLGDRLAAIWYAMLGLLASSLAASVAAELRLVGSHIAPAYGSANTPAPPLPSDTGVPKLAAVWLNVAALHLWRGAYAVCHGVRSPVLKVRASSLRPAAMFNRLGFQPSRAKQSRAFAGRTAVHRRDEGWLGERTLHHPRRRAIRDGAEPRGHARLFRCVCNRTLSTVRGWMGHAGRAGDAAM